MGMLEFGLLDPTTPHPPEATVSNEGILRFNHAAERVLALVAGMTLTVGVYCNPDDPPPMIMLIESGVSGRRPIPEVTLEKRGEGICVDLANIFRQLGIDFTTRQLTLPVWPATRDRFGGIAFPVPPDSLSWPGVPDCV